MYQNVDFTDEKFVGLATNENVPASTMLCFLIKYLSSQNCDLIATIPIHKINVDVMESHSRQVLKTVTDGCFHVVSLIADNHADNRSFFNSLSNNLYEPRVNTYDPSKQLYLLIDSIHIIKMSTISSRKGTSLFFTRTVIFVLSNLVT